MVVSLGHHAVLSEYSGVLYDPAQHTQEACVQELASCDFVVLLVGARRGSTALPKFVDRLDQEKLIRSTSLDGHETLLDGLSVTQLEAMSAFERSIPVFAFVNSELQNDRRFLERNRNLSLPQGEVLNFSSGVTMRELEYISKFLSYIENRVSNNAVIEYNRVDEILLHLKVQWSSLMQRMLRERQDRQTYGDLMEAITVGIQEIKSGIVALSPDDKKTLASQVMKYRGLCSFISFFPEAENVAAGEGAIGEFKVSLKKMGMVEVIHVPGGQGSSPSGSFNIPEQLYLVRSGDAMATSVVERDMERMNKLWEEFSSLDSDARESIYGAVLEYDQRFDWGDRPVGEIREWDHRVDVDQWVATDDFWGGVWGGWASHPDSPPF